jgi:energy-converting hydrogenase Eha subunit C
MNNKELLHIQKLIEIHTKNLHKLEETAAKFGMSVPLEIQNNIDYVKSEINVLQSKMGAKKELIELIENQNTNNITSLDQSNDIIKHLIKSNSQLFEYIDNIAVKQDIQTKLSRAEIQVSTIAHQSNRILIFTTFWIMISLLITTTILPDATNRYFTITLAILGAISTILLFLSLNQSRKRIQEIKKYLDSIEKDIFPEKTD